MQLISREEIKTLIEQPKGNCVSIYMPTHPAGPEVRQNPIRFKNLIREAQTRLIDAGLEQEDAIALLEKSQEIDTQEFWEQIGEQGLAIFISDNIFRYYPLPIDFQELVVVTDRFDIKPLQIANMRKLKTTSFVRAQHCCALTAWPIYVVYRRRHHRIIKKSLKQRIFVNSHHDSFVQCVSPKIELLKASTMAVYCTAKPLLHCRHL